MTIPEGGAVTEDGRAAWDRAVARAARISAEQDRQFPDEFAAWDDAVAARILGQDAE